MTDWQTIETAPTDGTPVLGWGKSRTPGRVNMGVYYVTWAHGDGWVLLDSTGAYGGARHHWEPSHWMPLPDPPCLPEAPAE